MRGKSLLHPLRVDKEMMSGTLAEDLMLAGDSFGAVVTGMSGGRFRENVFWRVKQRAPCESALSYVGEKLLRILRLSRVAFSSDCAL